MHDVLTELHARGELALAVAPLHGQVPHLARELGRALVLLGGPHRRGAAQPHVDPQARVAERLGERGELGEPLHPVRRAAAACRAPGRARPGAPRAARASTADGSASSTTRKTSSGALAASAFRLASTENRTQTAPSPADFA